MDELEQRKYAIVDCESIVSAQEFVKVMTEEYINGMRCMVHFIQDRGFVCKKACNCGECRKIYEFLKKKEKELLSHNAKKYVMGTDQTLSALYGQKEGGAAENRHAENVEPSVNSKEKSK